MLHAGVLMKLGHFSIIRVAFEILPETTRELMPIAAVLCIFSIIYGGLVAYYAKDTKYVIGYSSSSHMGYVFLGMAALDYISLSGAVIYMFAHAMATGMLFAMAGWVYDQTHTRDIPSLGGLSNRMPFISAAFVIGCMASIGMPGTVNFIAEVMIIVGSWNKYPFQVVDRRLRHRTDDGLSVQDDARAVLWFDGGEIQPLPRCRDRHRPLASSDHDHRQHQLRNFPGPSLLGRPIRGRSVDRSYYQGRPGRGAALNSPRAASPTAPLSTSSEAIAKVSRAMTFSLTLSASDLLLLFPELFLTAWLCVVLIADFSFKRIVQEQLAYLTILGILITLACLAWFDVTGMTGTLFGKMFVLDRLAIFFKVLILLATILVILLSIDYVHRFSFFRGEYYFLVAMSALGMMFMASANDLLSRLCHPRICDLWLLCARVLPA